LTISIKVSIQTPTVTGDDSIEKSMIHVLASKSCQSEKSRECYYVDSSPSSKPYFRTTTGLISSLKVAMESFQIVASHSIEKFSLAPHLEILIAMLLIFITKIMLGCPRNHRLDFSHERVN